MINRRKWPWVGYQQWNHILFCHWPVSHESLKSVIPKPLELDIFHNKAWLSMIMFKATDTRLRGMPHMFSYPPFLQLNVRTYIRHEDEPGVYIFSLDSNSKLAVLGGRMFGVPYQKAKMSLKQNNNTLIFRSERKEEHVSLLNVKAHFEPKAVEICTATDLLAYWLTERYCFYTTHRNYILKFPLTHSPLNLYEVTVNLNINGYVGNIHDHLLPDPHYYYAQKGRAYLHPFEKDCIKS